jgi:hypothetical protein
MRRTLQPRWSVLRLEWRFARRDLGAALPGSDSTAIKRSILFDPHAWQISNSQSSAGPSAASFAQRRAPCAKSSSSCVSAATETFARLPAERLVEDWPRMNIWNVGGCAPRQGAHG